jgi:hypothetical protein
MMNKVYIRDINLLIGKLRSKTKFKGCENRDEDIMLAKIYKRAGLARQFPVGDRSNPN